MAPVDSMRELIARCRMGEAKAFEELARQLMPWTLRYSQALAKDEELAKDIAQESLTTMLRRIGDLVEPEAIYAWMRQIIRTHISRDVRGSRELQPDQPLEIVSANPGPPAAMEQAEIRRLVAKGLAAIPIAGREAAELFYLKEHSVAEVSRQLGIPAGTVKRRLHDARRRLRKSATFNLAGAYFGLGDLM